MVKSGIKSMGMLYFVSIFVPELLWDFDNSLFDLVYSFLASIHKLFPHLAYYYNTAEFY